jgi:hypothetical protein
VSVTVPDEGGIEMSDQADKLRQLVKARREWRELAFDLDDPPSRDRAPRLAQSSLPVNPDFDVAGTGVRGKSVRLLRILAARLALSRNGS